MHDTAVFHLNIYTYRILCERLLLSSPPLLLHYRLPSQLLPTRYVCLRFVPQASARRFSASPLTQSYLPNKRRVTRQDDAFYVLCAGRKCAIFTFYTTPSSLLQPTSPRSLNSYPFFLYFWISTHFYSLLTFSRRFISQLPTRVSFCKPHPISTLFRPHFVAGASEVMSPLFSPLVAYTYCQYCVHLNAAFQPPPPLYHLHCAAITAKVQLTSHIVPTLISLQRA